MLAFKSKILETYTKIWEKYKNFRDIPKKKIFRKIFRDKNDPHISPPPPQKKKICARTPMPLLTVQKRFENVTIFQMSLFV